jgi:hypothetical protein
LTLAPVLVSMMVFVSDGVWWYISVPSALQKPFFE